MASELVLPEISAQGLVPAHDRSLVRQLRSSWNVRLKTSWTGSNSYCLSSLEIDHAGSITELQGALDDLAQANASHASPTQIAKALAVLTAVCAKPADFDDAKVVLWSERLKVVLQEYPDEVAMAAVSNWPKSDNGKWWPTENEIRSECDRRMAFRRTLKQALEDAIFRSEAVEKAISAPPYDDGFQAEPEGETAKYVQSIYAVQPSRAAAYLTGARYRGNMIGVRFPMAHIALENACPGLLGRHGVRIVTPRAFTIHGQVEWPE